ncbi:MAG: YicC/YloC family endoribonuclease, partial [bacterium]|nr:YicC/YloC family endoribonuclease [bacterium]
LVARNPEVFNIKKDSIDEQLVWDAVSSVASNALESLVVMRESEGKNLVNDIMSRIDAIKANVEKIEKRSPETVREYRERIEQKIKELVGDVQIDEQRLLAETAIFADRIAVAEETVRLNNHMEQLALLLGSDGPVGRKSDFIVQEMNREANTTGSKSQDLEINRIVVDIKSEIEKIREQIQNIE